MNKSLYKSLQLMQFYNMPYRHILEFGVHTGNTISQIKKYTDILNINNKIPYQIYGFDSFQGLPEDWKGTPLKKGTFNINLQIPKIEGVSFFAGWFDNTIPQYLKHKDQIALLHCDADLYSSTIDILYGLNDCICKNTIILFDEWYYNHHNIPKNRLHERKAFYKWAIDKKRRYTILPHIEEERRIVIINE